MIDLKNIPASKEDLDRYEVENNFASWSYQPAKAPLRVLSAKGMRFTTEDGRERLDFSSCFVSHNLGHQDQRIVDAICKQANELCSFAPSNSTKVRSMLVKMLSEVTPGDLSRSFVHLGGAEANETAIKIAHQFTGKRKIVARYRTYHGATTAPMSLSIGDPRQWAQVPGGAEIVKVHQPYCYRCSFGLEYPTCNMQCVKHVDEVLELEGGSDMIAAMICEPITGANGVIVPPDDYFPELKKVLDKYGILLIADEVMTGFGRTGKWFAMEHWNVVPDIMTMAKGITGSYLPMGATIVRKHIGDFFKEHYFSHGATFAGHALCCAAAIRAIQIYQEDNLIENAAKMGAYLLDKTLELKDKHPSVGDVRGKGLFIGVELVKDKKTREPIITVKDKIVRGVNPKLELAAKLGELGMMAMAGNPSNCISLAPALIVTKSEIDEGIAILDKALEVTDKYAK